MQFRDEDGVVTANEARRRSSIGQDDSVQRYLIRRIFQDIKEKSYYGKSSVVISNEHDCKDFEKYTIITKTLIALGYKVEKVPQAPGRDAYFISW